MNKKILLAGFLVSVMLLVPINSAYSNIGIQIQNNPVIKSNRVNTLYVGGNGTGNYSTIKSAIDNASDGDTVFVYDDSSPYYERLLINKPLNLVGEDRDSTVIDGNYKGNVLVIQSDYVSVSGFKIINCVMENQTRYVIHLLNSKNVVIKDNYISVGKNFPIYGIYGIGIFIENSSYNIIQNNIIFKEELPCITKAISITYPSHNNNYSGNEIYGYSRGIYTERTEHTDDSNYNVFYENNIHHNTWGIILEGIGNHIINNNIEYSNYTGISLWSCDNSLVYRNTITYNDEGISISLGTFNRIVENNIINNKYGLDIGSDNLEVYGNIILDNYIGVDADGGYNLNIYYNNISNSSTGVFLRDMSRTKISKNNFIVNELDGDFIELWFLYFINKWDRNYYDTWTGSGPFIIHGEINCIDWYTKDIIWESDCYYFDKKPAKEPYDITTKQGCGIV